MEIIVPAAGLSSRFPDMKPKYLLYDYSHKLMLQRALEPYMAYPITIGILKEHDEKYHASDFIRHEFGDRIRIVVLDTVTTGPADTVYQIITRASIDLSSEIFIKDCDSFFEHEVAPGNYVCASNIAEHEVLKKLASKSFVISNEQGIITNIIEKKVVSDTFCVGGYKFETAAMFVDAFTKITSAKEVFVSDVIQQCMLNQHIFTKKSVSNYTDVGTSAEWFEYNDRPVIFCDIDGTLIHSQSRVGKNKFSDEPVLLEKNVAKILEYQRRGSQIVFTTARNKNLESRTREILDGMGFENYTLIIGLLNSSRILINDYNAANPYPRAVAVNIQRNKDELCNYL